MFAFQGPQVTGHAALTSAAGKVLTPHGVVTVSWATDADTGKVQMNCTVPANTHAKVVIPTAPPPLGGGDGGSGIVRMGGAGTDGTVVVWSELLDGARESLGLREQQNVQKGERQMLPAGVQSVKRVVDGVQLQLGSGQYTFYSQ